MHAGMVISMNLRVSVSVEHDMINRYVILAKRRERDEEGMMFERR